MLGLLRLVRLEIELLNGHFNYELQIAVDKILCFAWPSWHIDESNVNKHTSTYREFDVIVEICRNAGLKLKNFSLIWLRRISESAWPD
eukprot:UN13573